MSFQYDAYQNQQGQPDGSGARPGPPQEQDAAMGGQMPDNTAGQFQGGNGGDPGSAGGQQQGTDAKTTLWYDISSKTLYGRHMCAAMISACVKDPALLAVSTFKVSVDEDIGLHLIQDG